MDTLPQIQTIIQEFGPPISTIIDAPWVNVTSVNGMTGDVVIEVSLSDFQPNHYYQKNTAVLYDGSLYYAKQDFTSGVAFNADDWDYPTFNQIQADWSTTEESSASYIKNKPTKLSQFTNDKSFATTAEVNTTVNSKAEELSNEIGQVDTKVDDLSTTVDGVSGNVSSISTSLSTLETTVDNMKTDGSVTKLGTSSVGNTSTPIYWNGGEPDIVSTNRGNILRNCVATIDDDSNMNTGPTITMKSATGTQLRTMTASADGLLSDGNIYVGSMTENNRLAKVSELPSSTAGDGWTLISKYTATSSTSQSQIYASVPSAYRGYPWEYRLVIGAEIQPEGGDMLMTVDGTNGNYVSTLTGFRAQAVYNEDSGTWCGMKWPCTITNDACAAELYFTRAGSSNYWVFSGRAGGFSGATPTSLTYGGRISDSSNITYFNLNKSNSGGQWLAGSHIEIYARKYT